MAPLQHRHAAGVAAKHLVLQGGLDEVARGAHALQAGGYRRRAGVGRGGSSRVHSALQPAAIPQLAARPPRGACAP